MYAFNGSPKPTQEQPKKPSTEKPLLDILQKKEISPLESFAKKTYGLALEKAVGADTEQNKETRLAENFITIQAICSSAVLQQVVDSYKK
jgi:hypothetical protein